MAKRAPATKSAKTSTGRTRRVTKKKSARRATKASAAGDAAHVDELRRGLEALRAGLRETVEQYLARIDRQLAEIVAGLEKQGTPAERIQQLELKTLRRIKPAKGRLKDLARIEGLADKLKDLTS